MSAHATNTDSGNGRCPGPGSRRSFLKMGLGGFASLTLPGVLRLRAQAPLDGNGRKPQRRTSVILVWQPGGCSHLDTYDPKPLAPAEYRGPFETVQTRTPGLRFTELIPRLANISDKINVLRSMRHGSPGHPAGSMRMFSGDKDIRDKTKPRLPDWMTVTNYLRSQEGPRECPLPRYVGVNPPTAYNGPAYVGDAYSPFTVSGDPNLPNFKVPNIGLADPAESRRVGRRATLREKLDNIEKAYDLAGELDALDEFEAQAMTLLTNQRTKEAFDLTRETEATRERYGRNTWGQQLLLARRLIEAGVEVVTTSLRGPLCGRVNNWDDHAVNHHVFDALRFRSQAFDQAVSALIEDVYRRGLDQDVLVVVTGEFGRTPKINYQPSTGAGNASAPAGTKQPGRDHWPRAFSNIWAGGGMETGQVIGATDRKGEDSIERICDAQDFLATLYQHLGIDYSRFTIEDFNGRPTHLVDGGHAIKELTRKS